LPLIERRRCAPQGRERASVRASADTKSSSGITDDPIRSQTDATRRRNEEPVQETSAALRDPINAAWIVFGNGELEGLLGLMAVLA
jgi:hypothetical protein